MATGNSLLTGMLAGALIGTVAGMLLAPKPGKDMRKDLGDRAGEYVDTLRERVRKARGQEGSESSYGNGVETRT